MGGARQGHHLLASAIWVGGLLWLFIRPAGDDALLFAADAGRVSSRALWAVIAVAFTGVVQKRLFLASWSGLVTSAYGLLVLAKTAGFLVLVAFGAYNRQRIIPQLTTEPNAANVSVLRSSVRRELVVVAIVILLGGLLAYVPPPNETEGGMSSGPSTFDIRTRHVMRRAFRFAHRARRRRIALAAVATTLGLAVSVPTLSWAHAVVFPRQSATTTSSRLTDDRSTLTFPSIGLCRQLWYDALAIVGAERDQDRNRPSSRAPEDRMRT